jgi:outer membrane protein TolC
MSILIGVALFVSGIVLGGWLFSSDNAALAREKAELRYQVRHMRYELDSKNHALNKLGNRIGTQRRKLRESRKLVEQYRESCKAPTVTITTNATAGNNATHTLVG